MPDVRASQPAPGASSGDGAPDRAAGEQARRGLSGDGVPPLSAVAAPAQNGTEPSEDPAAAAAGPLPAAVCVLGMGLIGGSLMRAAAAHVPVFGWSPGEQTRLAAAADGHTVLDTVEDALRRAEQTDALVVLAAPVTAFSALLRAVDATASTVRLTDVGSVKAPVAAQVAALAPRARYIGSHPMAGTAGSGWAAGSAGLFADRAWVTCLDSASSIEHWAPVAGLVLAVGSRVLPVEPVAHDDAVARISHLPHLLALALAQVGQAGGSLALGLAAGSFADGTRVAGTRPELIRAMCEGNAPHLVHALDEALALLGVARASLASSGSLAKIAGGGHEARLAFDRRLSGLRPVVLRGDDMIEQLLAVGAAGGFVTAVTGSAEQLTVRALYPDGQ
jgi:prephenate dehydrogenase